MMRAFPFTIVTLVIFNIVIIFSGADVWANVLFEVTLFSGEPWALTTGAVGADGTTAMVATAATAAAQRASQCFVIIS